jgi:hypothetical protein
MEEKNLRLLSPLNSVMVAVESVSSGKELNAVAEEEKQFGLLYKRILIE